MEFQTTYDKSRQSQSPKQTYTTQSKTTHTTYDKTKTSQSPKKIEIQTKTNKFTINQTQSPKSKFKAIYDINKPSTSPKQKTQTQSQLKIKQTTYQKSKASSSPSQTIDTQSRTIQSTYEKSKQTILPKQKIQTQVNTMQSTYPSQSQKQTIELLSLLMIKISLLNPLIKLYKVNRELFSQHMTKISKLKLLKKL